MVEPQVQAVAPEKAKRVNSNKSIIDMLQSEIEEIDHLDGDHGREMRKEIGGKFLTMAENGMCSVARYRFDLTHRHTAGAVIDLTTDAFTRGAVLYREGPKFLGWLKGVFGAIGK